MKSAKCPQCGSRKKGARGLVDRAFSCPVGNPYSYNGELRYDRETQYRKVSCPDGWHD